VQSRRRAELTERLVNPCAHAAILPGRMMSMWSASGEKLDTA
jgi:hypothetical protein